MKKLKICAIMLLLIMTLAACNGQDNPTNTQTGKTEVLPTVTGTTEPPVIEPTVETFKKTIIVDPGHGFSDPGTDIAIRKGISDKTEADININVAMKLKATLENLGYKVILTHDGVTYPSCDEIMEYADKHGIYYNVYDPKYWIPTDNRFDAYECGIWTQVLEKEYEVDMFISIHADSSDNESATGTTLYYCYETTCAYETQKLVDSIETSIKDMFAGRKVRSEGKNLEGAYIVTKYPSSPALLVEVGFCSNVTDMELMSDESWTNNFALSIANGIENYFGF